jgi:hypothetical protein
MTERRSKNATIYVFGSNLLGRHNRGEARKAFLNFGAAHQEPYGFFGQSFAIPTNAEDLVPLPLRDIAKYVKSFLAFARENPQHTFTVTRLGCHNNEYSDEQMAPLFRGAPINCLLPCGWRLLSETA